jgi:hypothetical protein
MPSTIKDPGEGQTTERFQLWRMQPHTGNWIINSSHPNAEEAFTRMSSEKAQSEYCQRLEWRVYRTVTTITRYRVSRIH